MENCVEAHHLDALGTYGMRPDRLREVFLIGKSAKAAAEKIKMTQVVNDDFEIRI